MIQQNWTNKEFLDALDSILGNIYRDFQGAYILEEECKYKNITAQMLLYGIREFMESATDAPLTFKGLIVTDSGSIIA